MKRFLMIVAVFSLVAFAAEAARCPIMYATNTQDLIVEIPQINTQLATCPVALPPGLKTAISNGDSVVSIAMNDGTVNHITVPIQNKAITGVRTGTSGQCKHEITISQKDLDAALGSSDRASALLYLFVNKRLQLKGCTLWNKFKGWFINPIGRTFAKGSAPAAIPVATGKPDNCDDTWLPGHNGYAENKATWDGYSANTDRVCQSQYGRGAPSGCVHTVQLSVSGNPYYLCWYNV